MDSEDYDKDQCDEHYNKPYSQDFVHIYRDKDRIGAEVRFLFGKGRESSSSAYGYYNKQKGIIKLNSFEPDGWTNADDVDENSFFINPCEIIIKKQGCFIVFKKISKPSCKLPSSFEILLKSSMNRITLRSTPFASLSGRCAIKPRSAG